MDPLDEGVFIAVEGLDGSGQSTQVAMLASTLRDQGIPVHTTREPTDGRIGSIVQAALRGAWETDRRTLQLLFAADRSHHVTEDIEPALAEGRVVITDRYLFSSLAYGSLDLDRSWLEAVNRYAPLPDIALYLDVPVGECLDRLRERESLELFEDPETLERVASAFDEIRAAYDTVRTVDGDRPAEQVHTAIMDTITDETRNTRIEALKDRISR